MAAARQNRRRLGDLLIEAGLLTEQQLKIVLNEQRKWGGRLGRTVLEMGFVTETAMAQVLAQQLQLPTLDLDVTPVNTAAPTWMRLDLCERYGVFPVEQTGRTITIATSDPTNFEHLQAIGFATNCKVQPVVSTASAIERAIRRYYFGEDPSAPRPPAPVEQQPAPEAMPAPAGPSTVDHTSYELDELLGAEPRRTSEEAAISIPISSPTPVPVSPQALSNALEVSLRREISVLREQVASHEEINTSQVRALRVLLEVLIESGLVGRDEYLDKLNTQD